MKEVELRTLFNSKDNIYVGKMLRFYRLNKGFSQKQLAKELGSNFQKISKYESGRHHLPYDRLTAICKIFDINIEQFVNNID